MTINFPDKNRPTNIWDEKIWAYANIKAARENNITLASELNERAAEIIGLSLEQKNERAKNKKLRHVVTSEWSRTDLKNKGLIFNQGRGSGVWKLTPSGRKINCDTFESFITEYTKISQIKMNYISQGSVDIAINDAVFNENLNSGNPTTHTSLIFLTLAFFAVTRGNASSIEIKAGTPGRKSLSLEYTKLVAKRLSRSGEDREEGYLSALGSKNRGVYQLNINKSAAETLSSNFFTNIKVRKQYADFKYSDKDDRLTANHLLSEFRLSLSELDPLGVKSLIILSLRSVELPGKQLSGEDIKNVLINKFGSAGEAIWDALPNKESIEIDTAEDQIAALGTPEPSTIIARQSLNLTNRLLGALSAKPFAILAGGTGTGKTNSARMTAASIAGLDNVETVAVGADWTDNRALLGFRNLLAEGGKTYVAPPALRIVLKALANPGKPYFLILDEMNLSHVERYFSDFLSSMESKEKLKLHDSAQALFTEDGILVSGKVDWPKNLFIIGTVNIDETTYMFSPKVLDRAHVIEFKVSWDEIAGGLAGAAPADIPALSAEQIDTFMGVALIKNKSLAPEDQEKLLKVLEDLHDSLAGSRFVFAHRTARECLNFIAGTQALAKASIVTPPDTKGLVDLAILQKALPKLNGAAGTLSKVLEGLINVCVKHDLYLCKEKLESMSRQLKADQFVSFIQ